MISIKIFFIFIKIFIETKFIFCKSTLKEVYHSYHSENRSTNAVSNAESEGNAIATTTEEVEYPDLLNENQSTSIGSNNNE